MDFLESRFLFSISLFSWGKALLVALATYVIMDLLTRFVTRRLTVLAQRTRGRIDDVIAAALSGTRRWLILLLAIVLGLHTLDLSARMEVRLSQVLVIIISTQVAIWFNRAINGWVVDIVDPKTNPDLRSRSTTITMAFLLKLAVFLTVLLAMLANIGVNISAFVASLGIGGVAIALASQTILSDLFASLAIAFDKPFEIGDYIAVDDWQGTVEHIGIKTTRLSSLSGEQLIRSNTELLKSVIHNYKRMPQRRVLFAFSIAQETPIEKVGALGGVLRDIINAQAPIRFDRAHFLKIGASGLDFEVVYYVLSADYNLYMDIQQRINLELMKTCRQQEIAFAYQNSILHLASEIRLAAPLPSETVARPTDSPRPA